MSNKVRVILTIQIVAVAVLLFLVLTPTGRSALNKWDAALRRTDVNTSYEEQKEIENTLRSYIASYEADKITYDTNKNLDSVEAQNLATAAKTRANRTAATYNQYYLKNSYVWKDNIPSDIVAELSYIGIDE